MDVDRPFSEFSGVAGAVLARSLSGASLVSGFVLGFALVAGNAALMFAGAEAPAAAFTQIVLAFALARFAVNGLYGEWSGSIFSSVGGGIGPVAAVALRYLALTAMWLVPALLLGRGARSVDAAALAAGPLGGVGFTLIAAWVLAMALTPPVFLVAAVGATGFGDLVSPEHWRRLFGGRLGDLFAVYVVYTGTLAMVFVVCLPFVALSAAASPKLAALVAGLAGCLLFGVALNLLGRLCGFFACGELGLWRPPGEPAFDGPDAPAPHGDDDAPLPQTFGTAEADPEATQAIARPTDLGATQVAAVAVSDLGATHVVAPPAIDQSATRVATPPTARPAAAQADPPEPPPFAERRPPLLDAAQRVEAAMRRAALEPATVIETLQELNASFAPDPDVLGMLAVLMHEQGHPERALPLANEALPMCFARGRLAVAARVFKTMRSHLERLALDREAILLIAGEMSNADDLAGAAKAYSTVIGMDTDEARAIKGLLQVAERLVSRANRPDAAIRVYRYLLEHCEASPLADFMRTGLEEAQRAQAQRHSAPAAP